MTVPGKDTEERDSRIVRSRPLGVVSLLLVALGAIVLVFDTAWVGLVLIVIGAFLLYCATTFPYQRGPVEWRWRLFGDKGVDLSYKGGLTDPVTGVDEANGELPKPSRRARLRRRLRQRFRSRGSAED